MKDFLVQETWKERDNNKCQMKMEFKCVTWNVNGLNVLQKHKCVFYWLNKQNFNLICLQEVHIKQADTKYIKNYKLGCEFAHQIKPKREVQ